MAVSALGVIVGFVAAGTTARIINESTPLAAKIPPEWSVLGIGVVALIGMIFGLWPATKAARLDPIEALRYE